MSTLETNLPCPIPAPVDTTTLHGFMKERGLDDDAMAALLGGNITPRTVRKWKYFERTPRLPELLLIEQVTEGRVPPRSFLNREDASLQQAS